MWPAAAGWRAITCRGCARRARRSAAKPCGGAYVLALVLYTLMFDASLIGYFDGAVSA